MKILDDLLSALNGGEAVRDIRQGLFHTAVLAGNCGLAATLPRDSLRQEPPLVREAGALLQKSALELARMCYSERIPEAAIGMATINSLLDVDEERCQQLIPPLCLRSYSSTGSMRYRGQGSLTLTWPCAVSVKGQTTARSGGSGS